MAASAVAAGSGSATGSGSAIVDVRGDSGSARWALAFGGMDTEHPRDVAVAADGTTIVVGVFKGECSFGALGTLTSAGEEDAFIAAIAADGAVRWVRQIGAARADVATGVATAGTTVLVAGNFTNTIKLGDFTAKSIGSDDLYVAAFDVATGTPAWLWTAGGIDSDGATDVAAAPDGGWVVTGVYTGNATFGGQALKPIGESSATDAMIVKLAAGGEVQWVKGMGGAYADTLNHAAVDATGNIYALGTFVDKARFGGDELTAGGGSDTDAVLAAFDGSGAPRWSKKFGGQFNEAVGGVAVDGAGNVAISGGFTFAADFGSGERRAAGDADAFVASFATDGTPRWDRTWGSDREDLAFGLAADHAGNLAVTGRFFGTIDFGAGGPRTAPGGNKDVFVVRLAADGATQWSRSFGDRDHDEGRAIAIGADGTMVVAGVFRFALDLTGTPLQSQRPPKATTPMADVFVTALRP